MLYGTGYARYQLSSRLGYGGGTSVRQNLSDSRLAATRWQRATCGRPHGPRSASSMRGTPGASAAASWITRRTANESSAQLSLDQTWNTHVGQRLSTSILFGRADLGSRKENSAGLAVFGGGNFGRNFSIDANARWNKAFGDADSDDLFANLAVNWGFARGWTASASYYQNRSDGRFPLTVESPVGSIRPTSGWIGTTRAST